MLRLFLFSLSTMILCTTVKAFPSDEDILKVEAKSETDKIFDTYYLNELFKDCFSLEEVNTLSSRLSSTFSKPEHQFLLQIATTRRIEYFGDHMNAFQNLRKLRQNNFNEFSSTVQSEYYNLLGYIAINSGNPVLALEYYKKALSFSKRGENTALIQSHHMSIGVAYNALGRTDEADDQFKKAEAFELNGPNRNSLYLQLNRALVQANKGNLELAKNEFRETLKIIRSRKDIYAEIRTLGNLADILVQQDSLDAAVALLDESASLIEKSGQHMDLIFVKSKLSTINKLRGNHEQAYLLLKEVMDIQNDYSKVFDVAASIKALESSQELKAVNLEKNKIEELQKREEKQNLFLMICLGFLGVASTLLFFLYRKIRRKNELLMKHEKKQMKQTANGTPKGWEIVNNLEQLSLNDKIYTAPDLNIEKVAKLLGTNRTYLSEAINSCAEMSFSQWLIVQRIEAAKKLLTEKQNAQYSIEGISQMVGFASISTFNTNFKKLTGVTPSYYRKAFDK